MGFALEISADQTENAYRRPSAGLQLVETIACGQTYQAPNLRRKEQSRPYLRVIACEVGMSDPEQFRRDIIALLPRLRRFAHTLTRNPADADDLVQDACMKALANSSQWDPSQPLDRWLFRITRNHWFSELRKRKVRTGEGVVDAAETGELQVESQGEAQVYMGEIRDRVAALPSELSSALMLVCSEGHSYKEVAELLEIPIGTVMSRIHRARKILAEGLSTVEQVAP